MKKSGAGNERKIFTFVLTFLCLVRLCTDGGFLLNTLHNGALGNILFHNMTEDDIIKLIRAGGKATDAGVKALYAGMAQHMLRFFVYRGGASGDEAWDILQEAMVKIVKGSSTYSGNGVAKAWIWQIARNCLVDYQRKKYALLDHEEAVNEEQWTELEKKTADPSAHAEACGQTIDECVDYGLKIFRQKEPDRAHALLLQMDGVSIEDIGHQIGRTVAATKEYLSQCRKKIQPYLAHCAGLLAA